MLRKHLLTNLIHPKGDLSIIQQTHTLFQYFTNQPNTNFSFNQTKCIHLLKLNQSHYTTQAKSYI